ncbi:MAG: MazG family protein [Defluviitaleaceae bacterium]|nr:MazG family protein [Defluviitaleaceae bacterium]
MITIVGLGPGTLDQLPLGVYRLLQAADTVFLRTKEHPVVTELMAEGLTFTTFDHIYERHDVFEAVYEEMVETLLAAHQKGDLVYAVPGHPMVAERVVQLLLASHVEVEIKGGQSFLDELFTRLKIDPIEGFQLLDATDFDPIQLSFRQHLVFCQVYDEMIASHVKLILLESLSPDDEVVIVTALGSKEEVIKKVPLYQLDHETTLSNLTTVYVPPAADALLPQTFSSLRQTVATLRGPAGCPWDRKQTHQSLKKHLREETEELLEALDGEDIDHLIEELGDVLLQVMMHAQMGEESGWFNIDDVIQALNEKLIRRHPHVFGDLTANTPEEAFAIWNEMKKNEKK